MEKIYFVLIFAFLLVTTIVVALDFTNIGTQITKVSTTLICQQEIAKSVTTKLCTKDTPSEVNISNKINVTIVDYKGKDIIKVEAIPPINKRPVPIPIGVVE